MKAFSDRLGDDLDSNGSVPMKAVVQMLRKMRRGKQFDSPQIVPARILKRKGIKLLKPEFLDKLVKNNEILPSQQKCPKSAFVNVDNYTLEELKEMVIFSVSYCWLSRDHPDPDGFHLRTIQKIIEVYRNGSKDNSKGVYKMKKADKWKDVQGIRFGAGSDRSKDGKELVVGVFIDWTALPQNKPNLRTADEQRVFDEGLESINIWYAHKNTVMLILDYLPENQPKAPAWINEKTGEFNEEKRREGHRLSGWTQFEAMVGYFATLPFDLLRIDLKQRKALLDKSFAYGNDWLALVFGMKEWIGLMDNIVRKMPYTPEDFEGIAEKCTFTNGSDKGLVNSIYEKNFTNAIGGVDTLTFAELELEDAAVRKFLENVVRKGSCLELRVLDMSNNRALTIPLREWGAALSDGVPKLEKLILHSCNGIQGDVADLSCLKFISALDLSGTKVQGDVAALSGLNNLLELNLSGTKSNGDVAALSELTKLTKLSLSGKRFQGVMADLSKLTNLTVLNLSGNMRFQGHVGGHLSKSTNLTVLDLSGTQVQGDLTGLSGLTKLVDLSLQRCNNLQVDLVRLSKLKNLAVLKLFDTLVEGDVEEVLGLTNLSVLELDSNQVQGDVAGLSGLTKLTELKLGGTQVQGDVAELSGLTNLVTLSLFKCCNIYGDVVGLSALPNLTKLNLDDTKVSYEDVDGADNDGVTPLLLHGGIHGPHGGRAPASEGGQGGRGQGE